MGDSLSVRLQSEQQHNSKRPVHTSMMTASQQSDFEMEPVRVKSVQKHKHLMPKHAAQSSHQSRERSQHEDMLQKQKNVFKSLDARKQTLAFKRNELNQTHPVVAMETSLVQQSSPPITHLPRS